MTRQLTITDRIVEIAKNIVREAEDLRRANVNELNAQNVAEYDKAKQHQLDCVSGIEDYLIALKTRLDIFNSL